MPERHATDLHPAREALALALDVDDLVEAVRIAHDVRRWFGVAKVGLELFCAAGPDAVPTLVDEGFRVFLDLKLHDIPTTVGKAAKVAGGLGASYLTVHARGGDAMLRAAVEGLQEGAADAGVPEPAALGVTILTSDGGAPAHVLADRVAAAVAAGCRGVVCAADDVTAVRRTAPGALTVVPGIRFASGDAHDQARPATPAGAIAAGADLLVVGRAVTAAADRRAAAEALADEVAAALAAAGRPT